MFVGLFLWRCVVVPYVSFSLCLVCASVEAELQSVFDVLLLVLGGRALDSSQLSLLLSAG